MIQIGKYHDLNVNREVDFGVYLGDEEGNEVLIPQKWVPRGTKVDDTLTVFVYNDHEQRPIATTLTPKITLNTFAYLELKAITTVGAFMDWGLEKDLMVPYAHQTRNMREGEFYVIYLFFDEISGRLVGSAKLNRFLEKDNIDLKEEQEVDLLIGERTDLGYAVIIDDTYRGLIYHNEIFKKIRSGDRCKGYIKQVRGDKAIDVSLRRPRYNEVPDSEKLILEAIEKSGGSLPLTDKSPPEEIRSRLEMSKKTFKMAIGGLYKKRLIRLEKDGIFLVE